MKFFPTSSNTVWDFEGVYGNGPFRQGIISEHVPSALNAGLRLHPLTRSAFVVDPEGRTSPVLCSELIRVDTEDGPVSGRCGVLANLNGLCDRHDYAL